MRTDTLGLAPLNAVWLLARETVAAACAGICFAIACSLATSTLIQAYEPAVPTPSQFEWLATAGLLLWSICVGGFRAALRILHLDPAVALRQT